MPCRGPLNVQNFFVGASVMFRRALLPVSLHAFLNWPLVGNAHSAFFAVFFSTAS